MERRKGLDEQIAELQSQYESIEQEDERSGSIDMKLISQKLDEWQKAAKTDVSRELINSCVAQITPVSNEEFPTVRGKRHQYDILYDGRLYGAGSLRDSI